MSDTSIDHIIQILGFGTKILSARNWCQDSDVLLSFIRAA